MGTRDQLEDICFFSLLFIKQMGEYLKGVREIYHHDEVLQSSTHLIMLRHDIPSESCTFTKRAQELILQLALLRLVLQGVFQ